MMEYIQGLHLEFVLSGTAALIVLIWRAGALYTKLNRAMERLTKHEVEEDIVHKELMGKLDKLSGDVTFIRGTMARNGMK